MFGTANLIQLSLKTVTYTWIMRWILPLTGLLLASCDHGIYTRDGVTDGDTFYLAPAAFSTEDPAYQSWVTYSLMKSTCQLRIGGDNPARASSFDCEFRSRRHLVDAWREKQQIDDTASNAYLDELVEVQVAGFLAEYTMHYLGRPHWRAPEGLRTTEFQSWRREHLAGHRPKTRITGSWNYNHKVAKSPNLDNVRHDPAIPSQ